MNKRRKELAQLDQETLIEGYIILEKRVRTLEKTVRDLRQIVGAVAGSSPPAKTPQNSSIPSSQARKANRQELPKAKRGPKVGHVGKSRERHVADEIIECRVAICTTCGEDLAGLPQHEVGRHQVIDIPPSSRWCARWCAMVAIVQSAGPTSARQLPQRSNEDGSLVPTWNDWWFICTTPIR